MDRRRKYSVILMTTGALLIAAALCLTLFNLWDGNRAKKASDGIVEALEKALPEEIAGLPDYDAAMPVIEIDGFQYLGLLIIPSLELTLPVMDTWDYDRLTISPCRYTGSYDTEDMVVCGHNYGKHFGPIRSVDIGADVYFLAVDGRLFHYQVSNREIIRPTAIDAMIGHTDEDWDLTLFTCTIGGRTRCAVRCTAV